MNHQELLTVLRLVQLVANYPDLREDEKRALIQEIYKGVPKVALEHSSPATKAILESLFNKYNKPTTENTKEEEKVVRGTSKRGNRGEAGPEKA